MGGAQGGLGRSGPRAQGGHPTVQLRLKIALVFDAVFFFSDFGSILAPKRASKIDQNLYKITFESALQLRSVFDPILIDFSFDFRPPGAAKT